jgi:hypothetical protein
LSEDAIAFDYSSVPVGMRTSMSIYRCCFLDDAERVTVTEEIDADTLTDAVACARIMLKSRAHHHAVEVWQGARRFHATDGSLERGRLPPHGH